MTVNIHDINTCEMPILQKHKVIKFDKQPNKTQHYACQNKDYTRTIFQLDYKYHTCKPGTKFHILKCPQTAQKSVILPKYST
ncbi:MAG: hypothetical protein LBQ98_04230 [Nitrososphaerota archaeon]|nr:hypothetical protein [Nitrososphaerota archaeon]